MWFALPADPYDPDEPETGKKSNPYVSLKSIVAILAVLGVVLLLAWPSYQTAVKNGERSFCTQNMKAVGQALMEYATANDDKLPPTHNMDAAGEPALIDGVPDTWVSKVQEYMSTRQSFVCPTSKVVERTTSISGVSGQKTVASSYGYYRGLSSTPRSQIPNLGEVVAVAESANLGALGSEDPVKFGSANEPIADGFLIGWNDNNISFSKQSKSVTRLAFYKQPGKNQLSGRHGSNVGQAPLINAITADGHLRILSPADSVVEHSPPRLKGTWWADPNYYK